MEGGTEGAQGDSVALPETATSAPPPPASEAEVRSAAIAAAASAATDSRRGLPGWVWIGGLVLLAGAALAALL